MESETVLDERRCYHGCYQAPLRTYQMVLEPPYRQPVWLGDCQSADLLA